MYAKYRVYLKTTGGSQVMAASNTVNAIVKQVRDWLENTSAGRAVYDDQVRSVVMYTLDQENGNYVFSEEAPANSRDDIIKKVRTLGGR